MNLNVNILQIILLLLAAVVLMLRSSFDIRKKRNIAYFLPLFFLGFVFCCQALLFYFVKIDISVIVQNVVALGIYVFYISIFRKKTHQE
jgi:hypothetical protein